MIQFILILLGLLSPNEKSSPGNQSHVFIQSNISQEESIGMGNGNGTGHGNGGNTGGNNPNTT